MGTAIFLGFKPWTVASFPLENVFVADRQNIYFLTLSKWTNEKINMKQKMVSYLLWTLSFLIMVQLSLESISLIYEVLPPKACSTITSTLEDTNLAQPDHTSDGVSRKRSHYWLECHQGFVMRDLKFSYDNVSIDKLFVTIELKYCNASTTSNRVTSGAQSFFTALEV